MPLSGLQITEQCFPRDDNDNAYVRHSKEKIAAGKIIKLYEMQDAPSDFFVDGKQSLGSHKSCLDLVAGILGPGRVLSVRKCFSALLRAAGAASKPATDMDIKPLTLVRAKGSKDEVWMHPHHMVSCWLWSFTTHSSLQSRRYYRGHLLSISASMVSCWL